MLGFSPRDLNIVIQNPDGTTRNRSGWLFQQLIKLSGKVGTCQHYLCIDADHVLIRPHVFLTTDDKTVFYMSYEEHTPYYENIHQLMPGLPLDTLSYVDHKMLFDKAQLQQLHQALTEFELYGNFVQHKERRPWLQKRLSYSHIADYATLQRKWSHSRWSLTFPEYMRQNHKSTDL